MIPPVIAGLINYIEPLLAADASVANVSVWDGEVPRWDANGNAVGPSNVTGSWPAIGLRMQEPGFERAYTVGANTITDTGIILVQSWSTTRNATEVLMEFISEEFEKQVSVYTDVEIGGPPANPNYIIQMLLKTWWSGQDAEYRTSTSQLLYRGDLYFRVDVHSNAPTTF